MTNHDHEDGLAWCVGLSAEHCGLGLGFELGYLLGLGAVALEGPGGGCADHIGQRPHEAQAPRCRTTGGGAGGGVTHDSMTSDKDSMAGIKDHRRGGRAHMTA